MSADDGSHRGGRGGERFAVPPDGPRSTYVSGGGMRLYDATTDTLIRTFDTGRSTGLAQVLNEVYGKIVAPIGPVKK